ncbi:spidroin-2-like isoform X1 [Corvus moneduloides]|uniref:spidroin-2-like isoform X1 n=1 Tax=Corvus moneduloides TaxID=1196302 RepID=UPI0013629F18|nr:spidroin-2-like isoform X1 [Corvus moneduloides]
MRCPILPSLSPSVRAGSPGRPPAGHYRPPRAGGAGAGMAARAGWARVAPCPPGSGQTPTAPGTGGGRRGLGAVLRGRGRSPSWGTPGRRWALSPKALVLTSPPGAGRAPGRAAGSGTRLCRRLPGPLGLRPQAGGQHGHVRGGGGHRAAGAAPSLQINPVSFLSPSVRPSIHPSIHLLPVSHRSLYPWSLAAAPASSTGPMRPCMPAARRSGAGETRPTLHPRKISPGSQDSGSDVQVAALAQGPALLAAACTGHQVLG